MRPGYGLRSADADPVWGARLIWPDDLVHDRQDLKTSDEARASELLDWMNGGALKRALDQARHICGSELFVNEDREVTLYEDERGVIKANPQASHGYLYVAAWLKS